MALRLREGDLLLDRYRIGHTLGKGGMAIIVAAVSEETGERVAIKYLNEEASGDSLVTQRFEREARAASRLTSRYVPIVHEAAKVDGAFFLVMEVLAGRDLERALLAGERLTVERAVDIVLMACDAMAEAHALGIVHRDLKPANLFLAEVAGGPSIVKVLDFGISKSLSPDTMSMDLTTTKDVFGSPLYMSPEQLISSGKVDTRADIWSLGVILYELLTGTPPFQADSMMGIWSAIMTQDPLPPSEKRERVPAELEAVVLRCLKKDPEDRYRTIADLAEALGPFGSPETRGCVARARALQPLGFEPPLSLRRAVVPPPASGRGRVDESGPTSPAPPPPPRAQPGAAARAPTTSSMLPPYLRKKASMWRPVGVLLVLAIAAAACYFVWLR